MKQIASARPMARHWWRPVLLIAAITAGAFQQAAAQHPRPTTYRPPSGAVRAQVAQLAPVDSVMQAYVKGLLFDTSAAAIDGQWLMNADSTRGPYAVLRPRSGSTHIRHGHVAAGDIMARLNLSGSYVLRLPSSDSGAAFIDTLPAGVSYFWVDSAGVRGWRMVLVPESPGARFHVLPCHHYPGVPVAAARIKVAGPAGFDDTFCFPCNSGWCCAEM